MDNKDIVLNIAVNLGRLSRWAIEGNVSRISRFIVDTDYYVELLKNNRVASAFENTQSKFIREYDMLKESPHYDEIWAEKSLTWSNILTHRAIFA
ncbi:MAG: hypothetical protein M3Q44_00800 [bacterium]|nr:hypothetical protein [bacterium]